VQICGCARGQGVERRVETTPDVRSETMLGEVKIAELEGAKLVVREP
jgi:hypothetical protein